MTLGMLVIEGVGILWLLGILHWYGKPLYQFWKRAGREDSGSILVEAAFVFPIFLLLILGAFDLLWAETAKANLNFLTQQAVVCLETTGCDANAYIANNAAVVGLDPAKLTATVTGKTVHAEYAYAPVGPDFPHITLSATAVAP